MATGRKVLHVVPGPEGWQVQREGGGEVSSHDGKEKAVAAAIATAKGEMPSQVKIHKQDGTFDEERTYGDDPPRYPG
jgi:hypothetical protein